MMKYGYARVSTSGQDAALQMDALNRYGCDKIYEEVASGAKAHRKELADMMDALKEGDEVVVWRIDRLGRSLSKIILLIDEIASKGSRFVSLNDSIDTGSANGRLQLHIFGALAEFERALISERTKAGLASARERGRFPGPKRKVARSDISRLLPEIESRQITVKEAARRLGVSPRTFYRHLEGFERA